MPFAPLPKVDIDEVYKNSFGDTMNEFRYDDPLGGIDPSLSVQKSLQMTIEKAVNVGAASGSAGYATVPLAYDRDILDITRRMTPLVALIPKVTNFGTTANYYRQTARGAVAWGTEQGALEETDDTRELASETIRYLRVAGKVTGVAQAGSRHFIDSMRYEVMQKTQTFNEELEDTLVNGDNATYPLEPNGLIKTCTSNNTDVSGEVSLTDVKNSVADCFTDKGRPNLIVTDAYTAIKLENQMMDVVRYVNPYQSLAWGLESLSLNTVVGRIPVIVSQFMPTTSGSRRIIITSTQFIEQRVLQDITFERLAKTEDAEKFYLKSYRTFVNKFPEGMAQLTNIT